MRISDWSSDVCSSDLQQLLRHIATKKTAAAEDCHQLVLHVRHALLHLSVGPKGSLASGPMNLTTALPRILSKFPTNSDRSEEHTSELQSLMRISYAVLCLKKQHIYQISTNLTRHHI